MVEYWIDIQISSIGYDTRSFSQDIMTEIEI
jgi:hypothetical protein